MFATKSNLVDQMTDQTIQTSCHVLRYIVTPWKGSFDIKKYYAMTGKSEIRTSVFVFG